MSTKPNKKKTQSKASAAKKSSTASSTASAAKSAEAKKADQAKKTAEPKKAEEKKKGLFKKSDAKKQDAKKDTKKKDKNAKPGLIARAKDYLRSVRTEMKRVVWPSKKELIDYSVAVCLSLVVVGVAIALIDFVISEGLVLFASLRG